MKNNNSGRDRNQTGGDSYNSNRGNMGNRDNQQNSTHYDKRRPNPQSQGPHQQHQQFHPNQRDRSGQRQQHPDSSMNHHRGAGIIGGNEPSGLGSVKFTPGYPTRELPPIETRADPNKKFTGRCRLFVGNLPHNTSEEKLRSLFERHGEVGEIYLGPKSAFAFVKMDTRQSAETARDALDCSPCEGRTLRVRLAAHAAAIRIKHLSPQVTNELLAYAFRYFGEIERAVVVVDDKGKSIGEGIVEYSRKQSALYAIKRCQQECFILTASPKPVLVEPYDQQDEDEGLPEKSVNKNSIEYKEQRDVGPRFAEQGSFEHTFALRWKELYAIEKQKRERLEEEIEEARRKLQDQIEYSRIEHDTMQLKNQLQQLEDNRMKLQQLKEQTLTTSQQREEQRRQQDMLIRQREEEILRRQQFGEMNGLTQQEAALRMQANALQNLLTHQDAPVNADQNQDLNQQARQAGSQSVESEQSIPTIGQMTMMGPPQISNQPRTFADVAMMGMNQQYMMPQPMGMMQQNSQMNQPNMFTAFMQPQQQISMSLDDTSNTNYDSYHSSGAPPQQASTLGGPIRREKYNRPFVNPGNNINVLQTNSNGNNNTNNNNRPRKRGRFFPPNQ